jgi:hypothetical protein
MACLVDNYWHSPYFQFLQIIKPLFLWALPSKISCNRQISIYNNDGTERQANQEINK